MKISEIREVVWPLLEPLENKLTVQIREDIINLKDEENLKLAYEWAIKCYEAEEKRSISIEGKSTIFIGTVGFLITILLTITKELSSSSGTQVLFNVIAFGVIIIYLCRVVWFAIKALQVGNYHTVAYSDFIAGDDNYRKRLIVTLINYTKKNTEVANLKVDYMKMAQEYFKRAICSIGIYIVVLVILAISKQEFAFINYHNGIFLLLTIFLFVLLTMMGRLRKKIAYYQKNDQ